MSFLQIRRNVEEVCSKMFLFLITVLEIRRDIRDRKSVLCCEPLRTKEVSREEQVVTSPGVNSFVLELPQR